MNKSFILFAAIAFFIAGTTFTACDSSTQNVKDAKVDVQDAKQDLKDAEATVKQAVTEDEWQTFKHETEVKIKNNEVLIAELKAKMKTSGKQIDAAYEKSITALEQKNQDLKNRIDAYDKGPSDWEEFKREFNHDMDAIGTAFKELAVDNKN